MKRVPGLVVWMYARIVRKLATTNHSISGKDCLVSPESFDTSIKTLAGTSNEYVDSSSVVM